MNLVNLRRVIYLKIMNVLNYEEAVHKLLKVQIDECQGVCSARSLSYFPTDHQPISSRSKWQTSSLNVAVRNARIQHFTVSSGNTSASSTASGQSLLKQPLGTILHDRTLVRNEPPAQYRAFLWACICLPLTLLLLLFERVFL